MRLSQEKWRLVAGMFPKAQKGPCGQGRPLRDDKEVLEGILWVLKSGARWKDLPFDYPPYQTCHRRFQEWQRIGIFDEIHSLLLEEMSDHGKIDTSHGYVDGSFVESKKGGPASVMGTRDMVQP